MDSTDNICSRNQNQFNGEVESKKSLGLIKNFPEAYIGKSIVYHRVSQERGEFKFKIINKIKESSQTISNEEMSLTSERIDDSIPITIRKFLEKQGLANENTNTLG